MPSLWIRNDGGETKVRVVTVDLRTLEPGYLNGQFSHGRGVEEHAQWKVDLECVLQHRNELRGQQRMSSQLKEVVTHTHFSKLKCLRPDSRDDLFDWRLRSHKLCR